MQSYLKLGLGLSHVIAAFDGAREPGGGVVDGGVRGLRVEVQLAQVDECGRAVRAVKSPKEIQTPLTRGLATTDVGCFQKW